MKKGIITPEKLDFTFYTHNENNVESQQIFQENKKNLGGQCKIVYEALLRGEKLTTASALIQYGIGDLRRRVKDLKDIWKIPVESRLIDSRYKEYYLNS